MTNWWRLGGNIYFCFWSTFHIFWSFKMGTNHTASHRLHALSSSSWHTSPAVLNRILWNYMPIQSFPHSSFFSEVLYWFLFYCCDKTPWPRQLTKRKQLIGLLVPEDWNPESRVKTWRQGELTFQTTSWKHWEWCESLESSRPTPYDFYTSTHMATPPTVPKQFHQLGTKYPIILNLWRPFSFKLAQVSYCRD